MGISRNDVNDQVPPTKNKIKKKKEKGCSLCWFSTSLVFPVFYILVMKAVLKF
ncbi:MAG: hypothetical protein GF311_16445 [Candidatus Lokiarchaeota archaeon]|nr:hypothetical protein [Candidatus Lokiarchaeota archaeon]